MGVALAATGKTAEAIAELQLAADLAPRSAECHYNLGRAFAAASRFPEALPHFEPTAGLTNNREPAILQMLAAMYSETGRYRQAIDIAQRAVDLATERNDTALITALRGKLDRYQHQAAQASTGSQR